MVDIDGVLCSEGGNYFERAPDSALIRKLDQLKKSYYIILFTSRPETARKVTIAWLKLHQVYFDRLILGKPRALFYVDDKAMTPNKFLKLSTKYD